MKMFKVEIEFDKDLPAEQVEELCRQTDEIFEGEGVSCVKKSFGSRVYVDEDENEGYGNVGAAIVQMSDYEELFNAVAKAVWYHNDKKEDMMGVVFGG